MFLPRGPFKHCSSRRYAGAQSGFMTAQAFDPNKSGVVYALVTPQSTLTCAVCSGGGAGSGRQGERSPSSVEIRRSVESLFLTGIARIGFLSFAAESVALRWQSKAVAKCGPAASGSGKMFFRLGLLPRPV